jgi:hypothetical protein
MPRSAIGRSGERGQALIETMLLSWILVVFVAAAYQLFLANRNIGQALAVGHARLLAGAFAHNCASESVGCENEDGDLKGKVIWTRLDIPEIQIPRVGMFKPQLAADLRMWSNSPQSLTPDLSCSEPAPACKRTRLSTGAYQGIFSCLKPGGGCHTWFEDLGDTVGDPETYKTAIDSIDDVVLRELEKALGDLLEDF